jgi:hypothetical protein
MRNHSLHIPVDIAFATTRGYGLHARIRVQIRCAARAVLQQHSATRWTARLRGAAGPGVGCLS